MRVTWQSVTIEGSAAEVRELFNRAGLELPGVDPQSLTVSDARRYQDTGRVSDYGEREAIDVRTGKRGVFVLERMGGGFVTGASISRDGRVEFEHPWDNPLQGYREGG